MAKYDVYERVNNIYSCDKCSFHPKYLLVTSKQYVSSSSPTGYMLRYFITTVTNFHRYAEPYLHYWGETSNGPVCLKDFKKIKTITV